MQARAEALHAVDEGLARALDHEQAGHELERGEQRGVLARRDHAGALVHEQQSPQHQARRHQQFPQREVPVARLDRALGGREPVFLARRLDLLAVAARFDQRVQRLAQVRRFLDQPDEVLARDAPDHQRRLGGDRRVARRAGQQRGLADHRAGADVDRAGRALDAGVALLDQVQRVADLALRDEPLAGGDVELLDAAHELLHFLGRQRAQDRDLGKPPQHVGRGERLLCVRDRSPRGVVHAHPLVRIVTPYRPIW